MGGQDVLLGMFGCVVIAEIAFTLFRGGYWQFVHVDEDLWQAFISWLVNNDG